MASRSFIAVPTDFSDDVVMRRFFSTIITTIDSLNSSINELKNLTTTISNPPTQAEINELIRKINNI